MPSASHSHAAEDRSSSTVARNRFKDAVAAAGVALSTCTIYNIAVALAGADALAVSLVWAGAFSLAQSLAVVFLHPRLYLAGVVAVAALAVVTESTALIGVLCLWTLLVAGYARMAISGKGAGGPDAAAMSFVNLTKAPYSSVAECLPVHWVPADLVSAASVLAACPAVYFGLQGNAAAVGASILASLAFDCLDGVSARRRAEAAGRSTTLRGQVVDIVCDKAASVLSLVAVVGLLSVPLFVLLAALGYWSLFRMIYPWAGGGIEVRVLCLLCLAFPEPESFILLGIFALATSYSTVVRTWKLRSGGGIQNWSWSEIELRPLAYVTASATILVVAVALERGGSDLANVLQIVVVLPVLPFAVRALSRAPLTRMAADSLVDGVLLAAMTTAAYLLREVGGASWSLLAGATFASCSLCGAAVLWVTVRRTTTRTTVAGLSDAACAERLEYRDVLSRFARLFPVAFCSGPKTVVINRALFDGLPDEKRARVLEHERYHCRKNHFFVSWGMLAGAGLLIPVLAVLLVDLASAGGYIESPSFGLFAVSMGTVFVWLRAGVRAVHFRIEAHTNQSID